MTQNKTVNRLQKAIDKLSHDGVISSLNQLIDKAGYTSNRSQWYKWYDASRTPPSFNLEKVEKLLSDLREGGVKLSLEQETEFYRIMGMAVPTYVNEANEAELAAKKNLKTLLANHDGFLNNKLESFRGRATELSQLKAHIQELQPTGGYITITGQAGQGKSSIIAKLIKDYTVEYGGLDQIAFHFIPLNPGPDHQVNILLNLMARLILKHSLSNLYVTSESRAALRDFFPKVLLELKNKNEREIIFIDGLDQLEEEVNGLRDLSFLPLNPPPGVIFVLGTRPNDTLNPLKLLKPHLEYKLPGLSRSDFALILDKRGVKLDKPTADIFYTLMEHNALYLDLVAQELKVVEAFTPQEIIKTVTDNPENIFSLSIQRLKRHWQQWKEIIKPVLGVLAVAREPLEIGQLRRILNIEISELQEGLQLLGGLVAKDGYGGYYLYHSKFREFLLEDKTRPDKEYIFAKEEEGVYHTQLAIWCEGSTNDLINVWKDIEDNKIEQKRREYFRHHYINHIFRSRDYKKLFTVLDSQEYGLQKLHFDPSTRTYALDLDFGREAAGSSKGNFDEGLASLTHLWRYTLLRTSLASRADRLPVEWFEGTVLLGKIAEQKALGLAELLTIPSKKVAVLKRIAFRLNPKFHKEEEAQILWLRAIETVHLMDDSSAKIISMIDLALTLFQSAKSEQALKLLEEANRLATTSTSIPSGEAKASIKAKLAVAFNKTGQFKITEQLIEEAKTEITSQEQAFEKAKIASEIAVALAQIGRWEEAEELISSIKFTSWKLEAISGMAIIRAQTQKWEEARELINSIISFDGRETKSAICEYGVALAQAGLWQKAEEIADRLEDDIKARKSKVLGSIAVALANEGNWTKCRDLIALLKEAEVKAKTLSQIAVILAKEGQHEYAIQCLDETVQTVTALAEDQGEVKALGQLATVLATLGQFVQAQKIIFSFQNDRDKEGALASMAIELAKSGRLSEATIVADSLIKDRFERAKAQVAIVEGLAQANLWDEATSLATSIEDVELGPHAMGNIGVALAEAGKLENALQFIQSLKEDWARWYPFKEIAENLAQEGESSKARKICELIEDNKLKDEALKSVIEKLENASKLEEAYLLALALGDQLRQVTSLSSLALSKYVTGNLVESQQLHDQLVEIINSIKDENSLEKAKALKVLALACACMDQWDEAKTLSQLFSKVNDWDIVEVWKKFSLFLAQKMPFEEASDTAYALAHLVGINKAAVEELIIMMLVKNKQWDRALKTAFTLQDSARRQSNLLNLVKTSVEAGQQKYALQVVQKEWKELITRNQAIKSLEIALPLIPLQPEIGWQFFEAFEWVNSFTRRPRLFFFA